MWFVLLMACGERVQSDTPAPVDAAQRWESALLDLVTPAGRVRYERLEGHKDALQGFMASLSAPWGELPPEVELARLLNAYNAAVLLGIQRRWPISSVRDVKIGLFRGYGAGFFMGQRFQLDGDWTDLYTLEHKRIREGHHDPRVHGALNCGSRSCPPLSPKLYQPDTLEQQLDEAAARFVRAGVHLDGEELVFNAIFSWYQNDFLSWGNAPSLCAWAARYDSSLQSAVDAGCPHHFADYDWSLNAARPPEPLAPEVVPWSLSPSACPPGMVHVPAGRYTTGMKPPLPYGVVDTLAMQTVDAPERGCPDAILNTPGATACWVQTDLRDPIVPLHEVDLPAYCMERLPFPGGGPYSPDGLTTYDAQRFEELLTSGHFGPRRLCSFSEYEVAVAGPSSNLRFIYGDEAQPKRCAAPETEAIGSRTRCENPETGLREYGAVISQWVTADPQFAANACPPGQPCLAAGNRPLLDEQGQVTRRYIVAGGTRREQTRQAPYTPHTWHDHGDPNGEPGCDAWGWDDGPAVCAEPDPRYQRCPQDPQGEGCAELAAAEARWAALTSFCQGKTMTACLSRGLSELAGDEVLVCHSSGELGAGQGR